MTKANQIRELLTTRNDLSVRQIAEQVKVTDSMVYYVKSHMKKKDVKVKASPKKLSNLLYNVSKGRAKKAAKPISNDIASTKGDKINSPAHYTAGGIETIDFIKAKLTKEQYEGYLLGNIIKYSSRMGLKGEAKDDAGKLHWYTRELEKRISASK